MKAGWILVASCVGCTEDRERWLVEEMGEELKKGENQTSEQRKKETQVASVAGAPARQERD